MLHGLKVRLKLKLWRMWMNVKTLVEIISAGAALAVVIVMLAQNRKLATQIALSSVLATIDWMEERRDDRQVLYHLRDANKQYGEWSTSEKEAADRVCRWFDILGTLDSLDFIDKRLMDRLYAIPASEAWDICRLHIQNRQESRGRHHFWEFSQFVQRVRCVKQNHPTETKTEWPRHPRNC